MPNATFLADVLKAAGLNVVEHAGWQGRGVGPLGDVKGVILHHTAGPKAPDRNPNPSLNTVLNGRGAFTANARHYPALPGPLSQLYLARDGTYHVLAAGRCNHAGAGAWRGIAGNSSSIGIEAENAGDGTDPWPPVQLDAYARGVAAILKHLGLTADDACGHKEFALPRGRKIDPSFAMPQFRAVVALHMAGTPPQNEIQLHPLEPAHAMLKRGDRDGSVAELQTKLGIKADGIFGPGTEAAVKAFQSRKGLTPDGLVGPKTWDALV